MADDLEEQPLIGEPKNYDRIEMEKNQNFINRSYWFCLFLFMVTGILASIAVYMGLYKDVLAKTFMISIFGSIYMILLIVMLTCYKEKILRTAVLLFVAWFVGVLGGFMVGVNLKMVIEKLD